MNPFKSIYEKDLHTKENMQIHPKYILPKLNTSKSKYIGKTILYHDFNDGTTAPSHTNSL